LTIIPLLNANPLDVRSEKQSRDNSPTENDPELTIP
jgi:hypothetical protein